MRDAPLTHERLLQVLRYYPETGEFHRLRGGKGCSPGLAGTGRAGQYQKISVDGRQYYSHRLAWLYMTGEWPEFHVDHRDGDPGNNEWANLRDAPAVLNQHNQYRRDKSHEGAMPPGVTILPNGKFQAAITYRRRFLMLGIFETADAAYMAYGAAKAETFTPLVDLGFSLI